MVRTAGLGTAGVDGAGAGLQQGAGLAAEVAFVAGEGGDPFAVGIQALNGVVQGLGEKFNWMWSAARRTSCAWTSTATWQQEAQPSRQATEARAASGESA